MFGFVSKDISTWEEFVQNITPPAYLLSNWIYRGQTNDWPLRTKLERVMRFWNIGLQEGPGIEHQIIREFRRRWQGPDRQQVEEDTLYCLALMQHHGAPTRLMDCSYSPYVAAAFAIEEGIFDSKGEKKTPVVWRINPFWCDEQVRKINPGTTSDGRGFDYRRNDNTFLPKYAMQIGQLDHPTQRKFICHENALHLNERLTIQQGLFLCPGDISSSFEDNMSVMEGWDNEVNVLKLRMTLTPEGAIDFARNLKVMNLGCAALFPGLDGFARSIGQHIFHYRDLASQKAGRSL
jgi:hypothetical protein